MIFDNEAKRFGSAAWASERDISNAGLLGPAGLRIGFFGNKPMRLETDAPKLTIAGAGAGKMRDLLSMVVAGAAGSRNFILDPRGEIASVTMVNFAMAGAHAYCWNPMGLHKLPQHAMQPLDILKLNSPHFHADCKFILESLIPTSGSSSGKYFGLRAREWGEAFVKMLVERDGSVSFPSLYRTINAIESNTGEWPDILECMLASDMESVRRCAGEMLAKQQDSAREFGAITGELYAYLNFLDDPMLQRALENPRASLAASCNPRQAATWFINVPVEYVAIWAPVLRTMFTVQMLYKSRHPSSPPINMIIDEAGQLGSFDALLRAYTFGRGAGVRAWALFQDDGQITRNFGPTGLQGFMGSAGLRQFFGVRDYQTAQLVSSSRLELAQAERDEWRRQAEAADKSLSELIDRLVETKNPTVVKAIETKIEKLEREKFALVEKAAEPLPSVGKFEECIELSLRFLSRPWDIYKNGSYAVRQTVLRLAFSDPLTFTPEGVYGTPKTTLPFKVLGHFDNQKCEMVPQGRIELPTSPLPRVRSTTELLRRRSQMDRGG